jgi:hypothetical protein
MFFLAAKVLRDTKNEEYSKDFFLWEKDSARSNCRRCNSAFGAFNRRHHCRLCGSLFCEACTVSNVVVDSETYDRICGGCARHETPGKKVRNDTENRIQSLLSDSTEASKAGDEATLHCLCPVIDYGSVFEKGSLNAKGSNLSVAPPTSGYFELINKSPYFVGIKVLVYPNDPVPSTTQTLYEVPRPFYISLPPNEILHTDISAAMSISGVIDVFILHSNPNLISGDINSVNYDTRKPLKITPCASIENFMKVALYRISCKNRNVLLKFKGEGQLEPRVGTSIDRKGGLLNAITGSGKHEKDLDFSTNIEPSAIVKLL